MRKFFTFLAAVLLTTTLWAQSPEKMSYQAVIRNTSDQLVTNTQVGMQISILQSSASGTAVYVETQTPTTNANGLLSLEIGTGTVVSGDFSSIDWSNGLYFIKTETDLAGGTSYTITGTSQLLSVPYALHAKTAETITGGITETDPIFGASPANGIVSGDISNWNTAYGWGNHATAGYLTNFTETDPLWSASPSFGITNTNISNWNTAFGWSNHATAGYLTSYTETDPLWTASPSFGITNTNISNWNTVYGWGNHATAGYLTSFTETDSIWSAASSNYYTKTNMQTSGQAQLHFNNLTNKPTTISGYGITDAFDGSYSSLTNKPNIKDTVSAYGFNGNYNDLTNKPKSASYRWATFSTYEQSSGWACDNNASLFGGVNPSNWSDNNYQAQHMSSDKEVLRTLFTHKGYAGKNVMIMNEDWMSYSSTNGKLVIVLFRIKNNTNADINWTPYFYYSAYSGWGENASVALNGVGKMNATGSGSTNLTLSIPANRVSTVIFVSTSGVPTGGMRNCRLVFYNNSLLLPSGLEFIDDLDTAQGGWEQ